jgi:hypothetical protein
MKHTLIVSTAEAKELDVIKVVEGGIREFDE